jgi:hypothetical protein
MQQPSGLAHSWGCRRPSLAQLSAGPTSLALPLSRPRWPSPPPALARPRRRSKTAWEEAAPMQIWREAEREQTNRRRGGRIDEARDGGGGREDDGDEDEDGGAPLPSRSGSGGPRGRFPLPRHPPPLPRRARAVGAAISLADPTHGAPPRPTPVTSAADRLLLQPRPASSTISASSTTYYCLGLRLCRRGPARATAPGCAGANCPRGMRERDAPAAGDDSPFPSLS